MSCNQTAYLLKRLQYTVERGSTDREVTAVVYDTRKVTKGCLFVCIKGAKYDSHDHAEEVVSKGARVIVTERGLKLPKDADVTVVRVEDTRYALAFIAAAWFGHPAQKLKTIGVTGTKGKTTVTYLVKAILENAGYRVGLVGTIETIIGETHDKAYNTTPESYQIQEYFSRMVQAGMDAVVMEVSSQGLKLHRTQGFIFDYGVFTNIEPDHIGAGEHDSFEEYLNCKSLLFGQCRVGIVNGDDAHLDEILKGHTCAVETYGTKAQDDLYAEDIELTREPGELGVRFSTRGKVRMDVRCASPGRFSVQNALAAIAVCRHFDVAEDAIRRALLTVRVKGRIEKVDVPGDYTLFIDYAHNAMALKNLLATLKEYEPNRLICLFGCGGNRSRYRRYEMGEISGRLSDLTIITSDNPRFEEPLAIMRDIRTGIEKTGGRYVEICDRREAIAYAMREGERGDIIVLAGKGHEDYQEIGGVRYPMDERNLIAEILKENGGHLCQNSTLRSS